MWSMRYAAAHAVSRSLLQSSLLQMDGLYQENDETPAVGLTCSTTALPPHCLYLKEMASRDIKKVEMEVGRAKRGATN
jgi:hypothetical protein